MSLYLDNPSYRNYIVYFYNEKNFLSVIQYVKKISKFRLVLKKPKDEIENLVNHLKILLITSLGFLIVLFIFDLYYAISFSVQVEKNIDAECLSDVISLNPSGCKDRVRHLI